MRGFPRILLFAAVLGASGARAADPLKIGVLMPTSGVFSPVGVEQINGMQIAIDEAGGTVAQRQIQMIVEDTEGKPDVGLAKARKLVLSDRIDVMTGVASSAVGLAVAPFLTAQKIPLVISNASANQLTGDKCDRFVFRVAPSSAQIARPMGVWLAAKGVRNVFIMASDFVAPQEYVAAFKDGYLAGGGTIAGEVYPPFNRTQDYGPYIAQARAANPGAVFAVFFAGEAVLFTKQYQSYGMKSVAPLYSSVGLTPPMLHAAEGEAALDVTSSLNYTPELPIPENKAFAEAYKKKFGTIPAEFAVMGYEAMRLLIDGVRARDGDTKDKNALVSALEKVTFVSPRGPISIDPSNHSAKQNVYIARTVSRAGVTGFETLETLAAVADPVKGCVFK